jgi:hypothetical protein
MEEHRRGRLTAIFQLTVSRKECLRQFERAQAQEKAALRSRHGATRKARSAKVNVNQRRTGTHPDFPLTALIIRGISAPRWVPIGADRDPLAGRKQPVDPAAYPGIGYEGQKPGQG